jgi:effector-binding domain-containing protein
MNHPGQVSNHPAQDTAASARDGGIMEYHVEVKPVASQTTAVVRRRASLEQLTWVVPQACGEVWEFVRSSSLPHPGRNLALYLDHEIHLEVGVEVFEPFEGDERVSCSKTPAGMVATAVHMGPYDHLHEAHDAIRRWCAENGRTLAGPNWEVYGHWHDDPANLRTDVFYLLRADGESTC